MKRSSATLTLKLAFPELGWHYDQTALTYAQYMLLQRDGASEQDIWDPSRTWGVNSFISPTEENCLQSFMFQQVPLSKFNYHGDHQKTSNQLPQHV